MIGVREKQTHRQVQEDKKEFVKEKNSDKYINTLEIGKAFKDKTGFSDAKMQYIMELKGIKAKHIHDVSGIATSHVYRIMYGHVNSPSIKVLQGIAKALEVSIYDLMW